jgi:hypothetical protein
MAISRLDPHMRERIALIVHSGAAILVGDADGADTSVQHCLCECHATAVTVYCSGDHPRNNVGSWPVQHVYPSAAPGTRAFFAAKDVAMAMAADYGLMVWDTKSTGTLSNVLELLGRGKHSCVFINKNKEFIEISDVAALRRLLTFMSETARAKADYKIGLAAKIAALSHKQFALAL